MRAPKGLRLAIALLLVTSAVVSISSFIPLPNVQGVPTLVITPGAAPPGFGTIAVTGSGWTPSVACTITATGNILAMTPPCSIDGTGFLSGSFAIATTAFPGTYTLTVKDTGANTKTASFTVSRPAYVALSVSAGSAGTAVAITSSFAPTGATTTTTTTTATFGGTGLFPNVDQGACTLSSLYGSSKTPSLFAPGSSCFIDSSGRLYSTQFVVSSSATPGGYTINVTGSHGDWATIGFVVFSTAAFSLHLSPDSGLNGQVIFVSASGAPPNTACSLQSNNPNLITSVTGLGGTSTGSISGTFKVGASAAGREGGVADNVTLICGSRTAYTGFFVEPKIVLTPTASAGNQTVAFTGTGFRGDVTSCAVSTNPSSMNIATIPVCSVTGTGSVSGNFKVDPTKPNGIYNITVTGLLPITGNATCSSPSGCNIAFANFQKVSSAFISVSPNAVSPGYGTLDGTPVTISGGGFPTGSSRSCTLSSPNASLTFASSPGVTCTISSSGTVSGSFAVAKTATPVNSTSTPCPGGTCSGYTIIVTDTVTQPYPPAKPFASTLFFVLAMPNIVLTPSAGVAGTTVQITTPHKVFQPTFDAGTCTISSTPSNIISTPSCFIDISGNLVSTSFVVGNAGSGGYTITVTGVHGDFGTAVFTLTRTVPLTVNPVIGSPPMGSLPGTTVTITGSGFSLSDTSCIVTQEPNGTNNPYFISGFTCTVSGGNLVASFVVAAGATNATYTFRVKGTPAYDVQCFGTLCTPSVPPGFKIVPRIALSPNSGPGGTQVTVTGSGFAGGFGVSACAADPTGGFPIGQFISVPGPGKLFGTLNQCTRFNDGTISGSFNVSLTASQGAYLVTANATGTDAASAPFAVGARLLTVTPSAGGGLTFVDVTGTGFVQGDASCALTTSSATIYVASTNVCSITNGNVQASFEVLAAAPAGVYNVIVTGSPSNDIGVGVFAVAFVTTTTTTSTSFTSTSTVTTGTTTVTSTTGVSTSLTTTTYQTTGASTETSQTFTTTTILAPTTTTYTTTFTLTTLFGTVVTTVVGTITKTLGQIIRTAETPYADGFGLLAILIVLTTWAVRRLLD